MNNKTLIQYALYSLQQIDLESKEFDLDELFKEIETIDSYYKEWCEDLDNEDNQEEGTTYENGANLEFYIESEWWHKLSKAYRKLKENK